MPNRISSEITIPRSWDPQTVGSRKRRPIEQVRCLTASGITRQEATAGDGHRARSPTDHHSAASHSRQDNDPKSKCHSGGLGMRTGPRRLDARASADERLKIAAM